MNPPHITAETAQEGLNGPPRDAKRGLSPSSCPSSDAVMARDDEGEDADARTPSSSLQLAVLEFLATSKQLRMSPWNALTVLDHLKDVHFARQAEAEACEAARARCVSAIRMMYDAIKEDVADGETLRMLLGDATMEAFEKEAEERRRMRRLTHTFGRVLERPATDSHQRRDDGSYPIEALLAGVTWPPDVLPDRREEYLSPPDFLVAFRMTREEFKALPRHVRDRMKKEVRLF